MQWNDKLKLIVSDVDETVADLYVAANPLMHVELEKLLEEGKVLFFISGQSVDSIQWRIVDGIRKDLRSRILIGHCSGVEVWGYDQNGDRLHEPFYSLYDGALSAEQKNAWRRIVGRLVDEFSFQTHPTMPLDAFHEITKGDPLAIMVEDRGPQITLEIINGYDMTKEIAQGLTIPVPETNGHYDLRIPLIKRASDLLEAEGIPITPRAAGMFAVDFAVKGVSKTTAVKYVIESKSILSSLGLSEIDVIDPACIEVWGDKFSVLRGGTDRHISEALPKNVRSISFRPEENPEEFLAGYNMVVWKGPERLHDGLLAFLKARRGKRGKH